VTEQVTEGRAAVRALALVRLVHLRPGHAAAPGRRRIAAAGQPPLLHEELGRQETWEDSPETYPQSDPYAWWRRHDTYDTP